MSTSDRFLYHCRVLKLLPAEFQELLSGLGDEFEIVVNENLDRTLSTTRANINTITTYHNFGATVPHLFDK